MTNAMIILIESVRLMKEGIIEGTGEMIEVEDSNGNNWKYTEKKQDKEETKGKGKMFLKVSAFFKSSQVDKKEEAK